LKKEKNRSALQRLKEKIKAKKEAKKLGETGATEDASDSEEQELGAKAAPKKLSKWERRQKRREAASAPARSVVEPVEEEWLQPVEDTGEVPAAPASVAPSFRQKRVKLSKEGVAKGAKGQHTFFGTTGDSGSRMAQLAEELHDSGEEEPGSSREAFLRRVAQDVAMRDAADAAGDRARIRETHLNRKRKLKGRRDEEDASDGEAGEGVVLGGESPSPPPKRTKAPVRPVRAGRGGTGLVSAEAELGDLEREALSRLGSSGLFG